MEESCVECDRGTAAVAAAVAAAVVVVAVAAVASSTAAGSSCRTIGVRRRAWVAGRLPCWRVP